MQDLCYIPIRWCRPNTIDVRDLPDAQVWIVREFMEFLQRFLMAAPGAWARAAEGAMVLLSFLFTDLSATKHGWQSWSVPMTAN